MIPVLFKEDEQIFSHNGIGALYESLSCDIYEAENGAFTLEMEYPVDGEWFSELKDFRIVQAKPNDIDEPHNFRIYEIEKSIDELTVYVRANTRTNDLGNNLITGYVRKDVTPQQAMDGIKDNLIEPTDFDLISDIQTKSNVEWTRLNPLNAIVGVRGSMVDIWGGEIKRTNNAIYLYSRRGQDNVTTIRPGKNIEGLDMTVSTAGLITKILPSYSYRPVEVPKYQMVEMSDGTRQKRRVPNSGDTTLKDDLTVLGDVVSSQYVNNYPIHYWASVDYNSDEELSETINNYVDNRLNEADESETILDMSNFNKDLENFVKSELDKKAAGYFTHRNPGVDKPTVRINVDMLQLSDSPEWELFENLERIGLTDTLDVWVDKYDIDVEVRVTGLNYDSIGERVTGFNAGSDRAPRQTVAEKQYADFKDSTEKYITTVKNGVQNVLRNTADGLNRKFEGYTEPPAELSSEGDIWFKEIGEGKVEIWIHDGVYWQPLLSEDFANQIQAEVDNATEAANKAVNEINTAVESAGFTSLDETISYIDTISNNAQSNAQQAINDASEAFASAQSALSGLDDKVDTSVYNTTLLDLEADIDSAITAGNTAKETAEGLVTQVESIGTVVNSAKQDAEDAVSTANAAKTSADNLSTEVSGLKTDVGGFELTVNDYQDQVSQFSADVDGFQSTVASYETEVDEFGNIVSTNTTQLNELRNDIDGFEILLASYDTDLDGFNTTVSSFRNTLEGLESTVANYETEVDEYGNEVATYATELSTLRNTVNGFESTVAEFDTTVTGYQTSLVTLTNTVDGFESTVVNYEAQVDKYGNEVSSYATEVTTLENTVSGFNSLVASFELEAEGYSAAVSEFRNTVSGLQSTVARYEVELDEYGNTVDSYATQVATFNNTVDGLESSVAAYEQSVSGYTTQLATLTNTVDGFNSTVTRYETQLDEYGNEISRYATQVSTLNNTVNGFESTVADVQYDFDNMEIGGRNLLLNSEERVLTPRNTGTDSDNFQFETLTYPTEENQVYTISADVEVTDGDVNGISVYANYQNTNPSSVHVPIKDGKITRTYTAYDTVDNNRVLLYAGPSGSTRGNGVIFRNIKIEKGNIATDWTPAPEDMASASQVSTLSNTVDGLNSTVGNYQTELIGYRGDVTQYKNQVSTMTNTVNGFNNTVTQYTTEVNEFGNEVDAYTTQVSTLENTVDGFRSSVDKVESDYQGISGTVANHTSSISTMNGQIALKANTTTVNALTGRVTTAETGISTNAGAIKLKANQSTVDALSGRVNSAETSISANATAIGLKASQTSVDTLTGTVSTLSGRVDVTAGQISSKVWNTDIETAVDGIEVGGRNLLTNSTFVGGRNGWAYQSGSVEFADDLMISSGNPAEVYRTNVLNGLDTATVSVWVKGNGRFQARAGGGTRVGYTVFNHDTFKQVSSTFNGMGNGNLILMLDGDNIEVEKVKLEKGNKATDWTPAPEDTTELINHVESELTQKHDTIEASVSSIDGRVATNKLSLDGLTTTVQGVRTDLDGTTTLLNTTRTTVSGHTNTIATLRTDVNGKATTAQFNTLTSTVNGTVTRVGNAEGRLTTVETNIDGLQTTVAGKAAQSQVTQLATLVDTKVTSSQVNNLIQTDKRILDTRSVDSPPSHYFDNYSRETVREFKQLSVLGISGEGTYGILETIVPWTGTSGGSIKQTLTTDSAIHERSGTSSWRAWRKTADQTWVGAQVSVLENNINLRVQKGDVLSQINIEAGRTLIQSKKIVLNATNTTISGTTWMDGAVIQTGTISSAKIGSLDVSKISGNTAQFVRAGFTNASGNILDIDATGLSISSTTGKRNARIGIHGYEFWWDGAEYGNMGVQTFGKTTEGLVGKQAISLHAKRNSYLSLSYQGWSEDGKGDVALAVQGDSGIINALKPIRMDDVITMNGHTIQQLGDLSWNSSNNIKYGNVDSTTGHPALELHSGGTLSLYANNKINIRTVRFDDDSGRTDMYVPLSMYGNSIGSLGNLIWDTSNRIEYGTIDPATGHDSFIIRTEGTFSIFTNGVRQFRTFRLGDGESRTDIFTTLNMGGNSIGNLGNLIWNSANRIEYGVVDTATGHPSVNIRAEGTFSIFADNVRNFRTIRFSNGTGRTDIYTPLNMGGNNITNQSDERLKTIIIDDEINSLEAIKNWRMAGFDWIDPEASRERQFGVIAQSAPEISFKNYDGYLSVNSTKQLQMTTHAVQQLEVREENTNKLVSQALQATESNESKIHKLQQELSKANRRIEELEGAL